jgi:DNA-binding Lrp family transcriptional regulator
LEAYILINTQAGKLWDVAEEALKLPGVKMAHAVTGQFDVIAYAELETVSDLEKIISIVQFIDGVVRTQTSIVIPPRLSN